MEVKEPSKGILDSIKNAATTLVKKVQRLIRPEKKIHKEVVINAETLETRVAVLEDGKLEEFTIERTTEERLVGSIFKGKVRNLEDGLKAAFVDIGFEKNAFLHYWDIVPNQFDSGVEIVERPAGRDRRPARPKITQRDIPRLYPPGAEIIVQVTKGPIGTKGPRVTTNLVLPGRYLVLLPNSDQSGISRKIENQEERKRLKKILRELADSRRHGRHHAHGRRRPAPAVFHPRPRDPARGMARRPGTHPEPADGHVRFPGAGFDRAHRARFSHRGRRARGGGQSQGPRTDAGDDAENQGPLVGAQGQALRRFAADFRPVQRQQTIGKHLLAPGASQERRLHRH